MQMSTLAAEASRTRCCVRCDRELIVGVNVFSSHQNLCEACASVLEENDPRDFNQVLMCSKCNCEIAIDLVDSMSYLCSNCSFVVMQMSNLYDLLKLIGCDEPFDDVCVQRLYSCNDMHFIIPSTSVVLSSDELGSLGTLEIVKSIRNMRTIQLQFLCDQLGLSLSFAKQRLLCDLSLNMIAEYVFAVKKRWGKTNISAWFLSIRPTEFVWGESATSYSKIVKYIPKGARTILDFGCGSGDGMVQIKRDCPMAHVVGYDVVNQLNPANGCEFISDIDSVYDVVVLNNVVHHVVDVNSFLVQLRRCIGSATVLILKDHIATNYNILLIVLLHVCHSGGVSDLMVFRSLAWFAEIFDKLGLDYIIRDHQSDIGDTVFVGRVVD